MAFKKRTLSLTGDAVTGAGFFAVTGVGHATGSLGLGAGYARLLQLHVYGATSSCDIQLKDADGVIMCQFLAIDASGSLTGNNSFGSPRAGTVSGAGVFGLGNRRYDPVGATLAADTVTGAQEGHYPVGKSPLTVTMDGITNDAITVDLYVEV